MDKKVKIIGLVLSLCVTCIILFFFIKPKILFEVKLLVDRQSGINFSNKNWLIRPDSDGIVNFNLMGTLENKNIHQIKFEISPDEGSKWYLQGDSYKVIDNMFIGKAQLGSREYPMEKDQHYGFRLIQDNESLLAQGTINAKVRKIYGTSSLLLIFITLLASTVQIFLFFSSLKK